MTNTTKNRLLNNENYRGKFFSDEHKLNKLLELAKTNSYSAVDLSRIFGCNKKTILRSLYSKGIVLENKGRFLRKYGVDDYFFSKLNPCSAYWAGFIAADGSLNNNCLAIGLKQSDIKHLLKFKAAIKFRGKINKIMSNCSAQMQVYSSQIVRDLAKIGIHPRKSLTISNVNVQDNLFPHFIRGVFDGDGSISGNSLSHIQFNIAGNKPFLEQIQQILIARCGLNKIKMYPLPSRAYKLQYCGSQIFRFLDWIYGCSDSSNRIDRKYSKYLKLKTIKNKKIGS